MHSRAWHCLCRVLVALIVRLGGLALGLFHLRRFVFSGFVLVDGRLVGLVRGSFVDWLFLLGLGHSGDGATQREGQRQTPNLHGASIIAQNGNRTSTSQGSRRLLTKCKFPRLLSRAFLSASLRIFASRPNRRGRNPTPGRPRARHCPR